MSMLRECVRTANLEQALRARCHRKRHRSTCQWEGVLRRSNGAEI